MLGFGGERDRGYGVHGMCMGECGEEKGADLHHGQSVGELVSYGIAEIGGGGIA